MANPPAYYFKNKLLDSLKKIKEIYGELALVYYDSHNIKYKRINIKDMIESIERHIEFIEDKLDLSVFEKALKTSV